MVSGTNNDKDQTQTQRRFFPRIGRNGSLTQAASFRNLLRTLRGLGLSDKILGSLDKATSGTSMKSVKRIRGSQMYPVVEVMGDSNTGDNSEDYPAIWGYVNAGSNGYPTHVGSENMLPFAGTFPANVSGSPVERRDANNAFRKALADAVKGGMDGVTHIHSWTGTLQPRIINGESVDVLILTIEGLYTSHCSYSEVPFNGPRHGTGRGRPRRRVRTWTTPSSKNATVALLPATQQKGRQRELKTPYAGLCRIEREPHSAAP